MFLIEGGLPGNINPQVKNLSNIFLYDLNDLEQFFSLTQQFKDTKEKGFFIDNIDKNHYVEPFFKKLNFNDDQIRIFYNNLNSFLSKNNDDNFKNKFLSFFKLFSK